MAEPKKKRSALLVNLALNQTDTDNDSPNSSNRLTANTTSFNSIKIVKRRLASSMSAQNQCTSKFSFSNLQTSSPSQILYNPTNKRGRFLSTHIMPSSMTESLSLITNDQNCIRQQGILSRILSTHIEYTTHTESDSELLHEGVVVSPIYRNCPSTQDGTLSKLNKTLYNKRGSKELTLKALEKSPMHFTSSSGPFHSWISQTNILNPKVMISDIIENDKPISGISQQYQLADNIQCSTLSVTKLCDPNKRETSENIVIQEKENIVSCTSKLSIEAFETSQEPYHPINSEFFSETLQSQLKNSREKPRRRVRTRGGKSCLSYVLKEKNSKIENISMASNSDDVMPSNYQEMSCKPIKKRGVKSCLPSVSNIKTNNIEDELTSITGITSEEEKLLNVPDNTSLPLSDEQLLQILEDPDEDFEDYIFDDDIFKNFNDSEIGSDSETSCVSEDDLVPKNPEEDQEWSNHNRQNRRINFEGHPIGLKIQPEGQKPINYFQLVVTNECLQMIVEKSNENASRILAKSFSGSRIRHWKDISVAEFKIFLGLLFHMGTIKLNRIQDYWKKHRLFNFTCFSNYMSRNRFMLILRILHFQSNICDESRLAKISPLVTYFNNRMKDIYFPSNSLCIDESLVLWRGRLLFRQYIKNKCHKYGIKLYVMTDIRGVILKIIVYAGAGDTVVGGANHAAKVVTHLLQDYVDKGYSVFMDNFYNSVELTENLLTQKTYCTGTLRQNRKNNPKDVVTKKLKKGEYIAHYNKKGVCVMKWRDNRDVLLISSEFDAQMTPTTTRRNTETIKPNMVINHNKNMGGIDHQDQMLTYYSCEHKTVRWYKKLGIHVLQQMLYNSFTLYNLLSGNNKTTLYDFRLSVIEDLIPDVNIITTCPITKVHVIQPCPRKGKSMRRRCKFCWDTEKKRKDTPYYCPDCVEQPGLCIVNCFKKYHDY